MTTSRPITRCQICSGANLYPIIFLGYLPPVNAVCKIGAPPVEQTHYPAQLLGCEACGLVQLGTEVDGAVMFPPEYPYSSRSTAALVENFKTLAARATIEARLLAHELVVDIGSNDGSLLAQFKALGATNVYGIEPTDQAWHANAIGVPTRQSAFDAQAVEETRCNEGPARVITACNVFAHIADPHDVVHGVTALLADDGIFVSESNYWPDVVARTMFDTIYHEHLRYYSLRPLRALLEAGGLEIFHVERIPTHGGSIRVFAARPGKYPVRASVWEMIAGEPESIGAMREEWDGFARRSAEMRGQLLDTIHAIKWVVHSGIRICAIGAPSRATTLINFCGLTDAMIEAVAELPGSQKIGNYVPGTRIPILAEDAVLATKPDVLLITSWHIADEIMPKLRAKGFAGSFLIPLPVPRFVR